MPHIKILNKNDIKAFNSPPEFTGEKRERFFYLPKWASELVESFRTSTNKIGFVLQLGYFKAVNSFFVAQKFHEKDVFFVANKLGLPADTDFKKYTKATFVRHQSSILENLGFGKFNDIGKSSITNEAIRLCYKQLKPRLMFMSLVDFLREKKIEIPGYLGR